MNNAHIRTIVSLDFHDVTQALQLVEKLSPELCRLKIGKELFTQAGPDFIEKLINKGFAIFLDLKFYDIPNTVAKACAVAADLGIWMLNVHASGGMQMMSQAREELDKKNHRPMLIGVTVLTSMDDKVLKELGLQCSVEEQVMRLAQLSRQAGLDGVVCSAQEVKKLRSYFGNEFKLVTPGIRPFGSSHGDQKRVMTPQRAIAIGSDYLVIGRPITQASDPLQSLLNIHQEISAAQVDI